MIRTSILLALLLFATRAAALETNPYGPPQRLSDRGRLLIAGQLAGWWEDEGGWRINLRPSASYFVVDRVAVGAYVGYATQRLAGSYGGRVSDYELGLLSSNEIALGERWGLWILARAGYLRRDTELQFDSAGPFTPLYNWLRFGFSLPFVYQFNGHVGVGLGPDLSINWSRAADYTNVQVGLSTWIPVSI